MQEKERLATERIQLLQSKAAGLDAALGAARAEVKVLHERLEQSDMRCTELQESWQRSQHQAELLQGQLQDLQAALQRAQVGWHAAGWCALCCRPCSCPWLKTWLQW